MVDVLRVISESSALAWIGALVVLCLFLTPIILRLAGLSGEQIVALLSELAHVFVELVSAYKRQDKPKASAVVIDTDDIPF